MSGWRGRQRGGGRYEGGRSPERPRTLRATPPAARLCRLPTPFPPRPACSYVLRTRRHARGRASGGQIWGRAGCDVARHLTRITTAGRFARRATRSFSVAAPSHTHLGRVDGFLDFGGPLVGVHGGQKRLSKKFFWSCVEEKGFFFDAHFFCHSPPKPDDPVLVPPLSNIGRRPCRRTRRSSTCPRWSCRRRRCRPSRGINPPTRRHLRRLAPPPNKPRRRGAVRARHHDRVAPAGGGLETGAQFAGG